MKPFFRRLFATCAILSCLLSTPVDAKGQVDRFTGEQIQRDLDSLAEWILTIHPSPFVHCSSIEFNEALESAKTTFAGGGTLYGAAQMAAKVCNVL